MNEQIICRHVIELNQTDFQAYWARGFQAGAFQLSPFNNENDGNGNGNGGGIRRTDTAPNNKVSRRFIPQLNLWAEETRLVLVIVGRSNSKIVKDEIIPNLEYWHHRSGSTLDILYVGLADSGHWAHLQDKEFVSLLENLERHTRYSYSGETDIILCSSHVVSSTLPKSAVTSINELFKVPRLYKFFSEEAPLQDTRKEKENIGKIKKVKLPDGKRVVDFSEVYSMTFERALEDKAIDSPKALVEKIIHFSKNLRGNVNPSHFSDLMGLCLISTGLKNLFISALPQDVKQEAKKAYHHTLKTFSPKPPSFIGKIFSLRLPSKKS